MSLNTDSYEINKNKEKKDWKNKKRISNLWDNIRSSNIHGEEGFRKKERKYTGKIFEEITIDKSSYFMIKQQPTDKRSSENSKQDKYKEIHIFGIL